MLNNQNYKLRLILSYLESKNITYNLPKPGIKSQSEVNNVYIYNEVMYRLKDTTEWYNKEDFDAENGEFVEVSTVSFDKTRWSQPQLIQWGNQCFDLDNNQDYQQCTSEVNENYVKCLIDCGGGQSCSAACNREYEQNLNKCPCQVS